MTRALLITNPAAARTDARAVTAIRETLRGGGWDVEVLATLGPKDARRFAAEARDQKFDVLVVDATAEGAELAIEITILSGEHKGEKGDGGACRQQFA